MHTWQPPTRELSSKSLQQQQGSFQLAGGVTEGKAPRAHDKNVSVAVQNKGNKQTKQQKNKQIRVFLYYQGQDPES